MSGDRSQTKQILSEELESLRKRIIERHIAAGQKASGRTISSLSVTVNDDEGTLYGRKAFGVLETGRRGGKVPKGFYKIIQQWVKDKGLTFQPIQYKRKPSNKWQPKYTPEQRGLQSFSGAVAHKIAAEGTRLHRSGVTEDIYSTEIEKTVEAIHKRVFGIFEKDVDSIHINAIKDEN